MPLYRSFFRLFRCLRGHLLDQGTTDFLVQCSSRGQLLPACRIATGLWIISPLSRRAVARIYLRYHGKHCCPQMGREALSSTDRGTAVWCGGDVVCGHFHLQRPHVVSLASLALQVWTGEAGVFLFAAFVLGLRQEPVESAKGHRQGRRGAKGFRRIRTHRRCQLRTCQRECPGQAQRRGASVAQDLWSQRGGQQPVVYHVRGSDLLAIGPQRCRQGTFRFRYE